MSSLAPTISRSPLSAAETGDGKRFNKSFLVSAGVHLGGLALLVGLTALVSNNANESPAVFELVAGEGNNYMATEAPSGSEAGTAADGAVALPAMDPVQNWTPPAPTAMEAVAPPPEAAPLPKTATTAATAAPNFVKTINSKIKQAKAKADREIKKQRAADQQAALEAAKKAEAAANQAKAAKAAAMTHDQFVKSNPNAATTGPRTRSATSAPAASPGARIDANGILRRGVTGATGAGSTGAGGTALSRAEANAMDAYFSFLMQKLRENHEKPPGLSDLLNAQVAFTVGSDGTLFDVHITSSSGNAAFDQSVLDAFARTRLDPPPNKKTEAYHLTFLIKEA